MRHDEITIDCHQLERCAQISDLGAILDAITFRDHVYAVVSKANRMLGLLMRSMQLSARARMPIFDHRAVLCAYHAHVRSGVIWGV